MKNTEKLKKDLLREGRQDELLPREKCRLLGAAALEDRELLAILLRTGTRSRSVLKLAEEVLRLNPQFDGLAGLPYFSPEDFMQISGIGETKALELSVVGEIARRIWNRNIRKNVRTFTGAEEVLQFYKEELRYLQHEEVHVLFLDHQMQLIRDHKLFSGTCNQSAVSPREIFIEALRLRAVCLILVHNHPSGQIHPSQDDIALTDSMKKAGECIGIELIDHVIIGDNRFFSFKEQGMI